MSRFDRSRRIRLLVVALVLRLAVVALGAEPALAQREGTLVFQAEVVRKGESVSGLKAEDFVVRDKGKPVPVIELLEIDGQAEFVPDAAYRRLYLLFDLEFSSPLFVVQATDVARELLTPDRLAATEVAIVAHEPGVGLRVEVDPTDDVTRLTEKLHTMRSEHERRLGSPRVASEPTIRVSGDDLIEARARGTESDKGIVQQAQGRILELLRSLKRLEPMTRTVPGSSRVVIFSPGFDSSVILGNQVTDGFDAARSAARSEAAATGNLTATGGATRYGGGLVEEALFETLSEYDRSGVPIDAVQIELVGESSTATRGARGANGLSIVTGRTGGRVLRGTRPELLEAIDAFHPAGHLYLLTIQPRGTESGRYRKLDVGLKNRVKGTKVLAPPGYYVP